MAVNKVEIIENGTTRTLVDLTKDTVTPETLAVGYTAHGANGEQFEGVMQSGNGGGDMLMSVYDPQGKAQDIFAYVDKKIEGITGVTEDDVTRLSYIESTGAQYFEIPYRANSQTRIILDVTLNGEIGAALFGARTAYKDCHFDVYTEASGLRFDFGSQSVTLGSNGYTGRHKIEINGNVVYFDDEKAVLDAETFLTNYNLFLFALNNQNTVRFYCTMRLHTCQLYENGCLLMEYTPSIDGGKVCIYDEVNKSYLYGKGTAKFIAGEILEA